MILRRPYAFLIKHFRLIHLILFGFLSYITVRANNILSFYKEYISLSGNIEVISSNFINYFIFVSVFLIIVFSFIIYFLMRYKKKPRILYIIVIISTIISLILFIYLYLNIKALETTTMSGREIRLLRDISRFNFYLLFVTCIPILIRGLGFDIKKFNFTSDIADLKLEKEDSEEVEVNVELNSDALKRSGRKLSRELKYYYIENKFFINIILGVIIIILIFIFPFNKYVVNRNLNEGEVLKTNYFNMEIKNSYISERKRVSKNNSYIILKINIKGKLNKYSLDLDEFVLESKNNKYIPSLKYYYYFNDIGVGYREEKLDTEKYKEYILIYNIDNTDKNSNFYLNYLGDDRKIKLNLKNLD